MEAEEVITLLGVAPKLGPVGTYVSLQPRVLLRHALGLIGDSPDWRLPGLEVLARQDRLSNTDYVSSLLAYLRADGNVAAAQRRTQRPADSRAP